MWPRGTRDSVVLAEALRHEQERVRELEKVVRMSGPTGPGAEPLGRFIVWMAVGLIASPFILTILVAAR